MRCSGFGVMEALYQDEEIVFETDDEEEAYKEADRLLHANNSEETIKSSWIPNTYWVHANTATEIGQRALDKFRAEVEVEIQKAKDSGNYYEVKPGEQLNGFPDPKITGKALSRIIWTDGKWINL